MIVVFEKTYLSELYEKGKCTEKRYRFQPQVVKGYQKCVRFLIAASRKEDLFLINSLHFEALHGDHEGLFSVRVNDQYRLEFFFDTTEEEPVLTVCRITELSNHYK